MSLFEHRGFQYRETCFVLFPQENRPKLAEVLSMVETLGERYKIGENEAADDGLMESVTIFCPHDHAALDISFVIGEEVMEHLGELADEFPTETLDEAELAKWREAQSYDARLDLFHFEELSPGSEDADELLDPGAMLVVLQALSKLTAGVGIDPSSEAVF